MRRVRLVALAFTPCIPLIAAIGCEDGPNDPYQAAPAGAATVWNDGKSAATVGSAAQYYDGGISSSTNKVDLCSAAQIAAARKKYFAAPILPPGLGGGVDLAGGPNGNGNSSFDPTDKTKVNGSYYASAAYKASETWVGTTLSQAEAFLCQSSPTTFYDPSIPQAGWGDQQEISVVYDANSRLIQEMDFSPGYLGTVELDADPKGIYGAKHYSWNLQNQPIQVSTAGGTPTGLSISWDSSADPTKAGASNYHNVAHELYNAFVYTFPNGFPAEEDCELTSHCAAFNLGGLGFMYFFPFQVGFYTASAIADSTANNSVLSGITLRKTKILGISNAAATMRLDALGRGPDASAKNVLGTTKSCDFVLGQDFIVFRDSCVEPFDATNPPPADGTDSNKIEDNKLFGAMRHDDQTYTFDFVGIDPDFGATSLPDTAVVSDTDRPKAGDLARRLRIDQNAVGPLTNDYVGNDATKAIDAHGRGLVDLEWLTLIQHYMQANAGVTTDLGDADCIANPGRYGAATCSTKTDCATGFTCQVGASGLEQCAAPSGTSPTVGACGPYACSAKGLKICSGLEGAATSAPPASVSDYALLPGSTPGQLSVNALGTAAFSAFSDLTAGMHPSASQTIHFCTDAGGVASDGTLIGYQSCPSGGTNYPGPFEAILYQVQATLDDATRNQLPELNDPRFYFQQFASATIKYLQNADTPAATIKTIDQTPLDFDSLFFDAVGGGQFELAEYVDRRGVATSPTHQPIDLVINADPIHGIVDSYEFTAFNERGEAAIYAAFATGGQLPGAQSVLLSNLVGSPVLQSAYGSYACAINTDPTACGGLLGPADATGAPLYAAYSGAFGHTIFSISNGSSTYPSGITVTSLDPLLGQAMVSIPVYQDPYSVGSATNKTTSTISKLLPYVPKEQTSGFPVAFDGSRDKFVSTYSVDFSGVSLSLNVDWDLPTSDVATPEDIASLPVDVGIKAIETTDFFGAIFACVEPDPTTGNPDVLSIRMYTSAQVVLDYLGKYDGAVHDGVTYPNAVADCGVVLTYSTYGNKLDYITSQTNGFRFGINATSGTVGRIVDVTVFDPSIVTSLGN